MNDERVVEFLQMHGDSTLFTLKGFSNITDEDIKMLVVGLRTHLSSFYPEAILAYANTQVFHILCVIEEIDDKLAKEMQEYRGTYINIMVAGNLLDDGEEILSFLHLGLESSNILSEMIGVKEVKNNV